MLAVKNAGRGGAAVAAAAGTAGRRAAARSLRAALAGGRGRAARSAVAEVPCVRGPSWSWQVTARVGVWREVGVETGGCSLQMS